MQCWLSASYEGFAQPIFKAPEVKQHSSWTAWPLKMGLIGHSKRSVTNCQPALHNIPEDQRSRLPCSRSWKSRIPEEQRSHLSFLVCFLLCRNLISTAFKLLYFHMLIHMQVPYMPLKVCWNYLILSYS